MTVTALLHSALRGPCSPPLRLLPERAASLLEGLQAPPRLAAHLRLVHDVACQLADWADIRHPRNVTSIGSLPMTPAWRLVGAEGHA